MLPEPPRGVVAIAQKGQRSVAASSSSSSHYDDDSNRDGDRRCTAWRRGTSVRRRDGERNIVGRVNEKESTGAAEVAGSGDATGVIDDEHRAYAAAGRSIQCVSYVGASASAGRAVCHCLYKNHRCAHGYGFARNVTPSPWPSPPQSSARRRDVFQNLLVDDSNSDDAMKTTKHDDNNINNNSPKKCAVAESRALRKERRISHSDARDQCSLVGIGSNAKEVGAATVGGEGEDRKVDTTARAGTTRTASVQLGKVVRTR